MLKTKVLKKSKNVTNTKIRCCSLIYFSFKLKNGEIRKRDWLIYSPSTGKIFCFFCLLFQGSDDNFRSGFNDWAHGLRSIHRHGQSKQHSDAVQCYVGKVTLKGKIDTHLKQQLEDKKRYWREVLRRVVEWLKFLCSRGLALRGDSEEIGNFSNGNFLGALEFLAKFDPFLAKHLESRGKQGRGNVSYISSISYEEIVFLMAKNVLDSISSEIASAKYFSLIVDSSTDTSHCNQLAIIIRYVARKLLWKKNLLDLNLHADIAERLWQMLSRKY